MSEPESSEFSEYRRLILANFERQDEDIKDIKAKLEELSKNVATLRAQMVIAATLAAFVGAFMIEAAINFLGANGG